MTRIDFHSGVQDKLGYACRLVRKARANRCNLVVLADDEDQLATLDTALWTFAQDEFLPHVRVDDPLAAVTPILLACDTGLHPAHHEVLVNLSSRTPEYFARFERVIEVVSREEADVMAGRERFRHYKQRGYVVDHHQADKE